MHIHLFTDNTDALSLLMAALPTLPGVLLVVPRKGSLLINYAFCQDPLPLMPLALHISYDCASFASDHCLPFSAE